MFVYLYSDTDNWTELIDVSHNLNSKVPEWLWWGITKKWKIILNAEEFSWFFDREERKQQSCISVKKKQRDFYTGQVSETVYASSNELFSFPSPFLLWLFCPCLLGTVTSYRHHPFYLNGGCSVDVAGAAWAVTNWGSTSYQGQDRDWKAGTLIKIQITFIQNRGKLEWSAQI